MRTLRAGLRLRLFRAGNRDGLGGARLSHPAFGAAMSGDASGLRRRRCPNQSNRDFVVP